MTAFPDLVIPPECAGFADVEEVFEFGYCHALAVEIHRITSWPIVGLYRRNHKTGRPEPADHYVARREDGQLADVRGIQDLQVFEAQGYQVSQPVDADGLWSALDMENAEDVRELAEQVAARIVRGEV